MTLKVSPLAPETGLPDFPEIAGIRLATAASGVKYTDREDLLIVDLDQDTVAAGVFTRSTAAGAPVVWSRECLKQPVARGLVVNAGNANVFTGECGEADVRRMAEKAAEVLKCKPAEIFVASTGVIGEPLPVEKIVSSMDEMGSGFAADNWWQACHAILTTDTFAKGAVKTASLMGESITICGMAKGSGMIEPDMATMLAFVFTDANIEKSVLQKLLVESNAQSFNKITVDSDTSTSDTCLLFATGKASNRRVDNEKTADLTEFRRALSELMLDLALQVVRDGEGASKLIHVRVEGAANTDDADLIAKTIANSPLVKTAIAGEDANWGRVVMAVGKSGVQYRHEALEIGFGGMKITNNGNRIENYDESKLTRHLQGKEVEINVNLGEGEGSSSVWTCDLTHGYISINADYRS